MDCGNPVAESRGPLAEDGRRGVTLYSCSGDASSIRQCGFIGGPGYCYSRYYHHVTCSGKRLVILRDLFIHYTILPCIIEKIVRLLSLSFLFSEPDDVRLVGGGSRCAGGVEQYDQGEWRTVGAENWARTRVAAVVCRQLGCGSAVSVLPGNTTGRFEVICSGSESVLRECSRSYDLCPGLTVICSVVFYGTTNTCQPQSTTAVRITESLSSSVLTTVFSSLLFTAELSVRLVDGTTSCSGTVEVFYRGEWLGLCTGWWWSMRDVKVVCRELDCGNPVAESRGPLVEHRRGVRLLRCSGDESSIRQCDIIGGPVFCNRGYYHHVTCSGKRLSVRLVDGAGLCSGRVEVKSNQSWASVCEADFDRQDAEVVCGELGCGAPAALQGGLYGEGEGQTWDKEFQCKGKESLLLDCDTSDRENNTCLPGNAVGLTCSEPDDVRLVGGGSRCAGGVERYDQGEWRTVGAVLNQEYVAAVVCRQLGCGSTVSALPGNTTGGNNIICSGSESSLREITQSLSSSVLTTVFSSLLFTAELSVRLVDGTTSCSGTVEVFFRREWSVLCSVLWSMMREVKVVCRELDCGNPVAESRRPLVEDGRRGVRLLRCSGDESSIRQCVIIGGGPGACSGGYYHHVTCSGKRLSLTVSSTKLIECSTKSFSPESVRLVDGAGLCSGRVEVKSNQSWASVCEADFDRQDAEVVCGVLGCGAPAALQGGLYGEGEGQTWDKEFQCKGKESLLLDCDTSDRENNTCLPGNAVGLTCSGKKPFVTQSTLFLTWSSRCAGGVERYDQGEWRTVGSDWNQRDVAAVVCRQLGCGSTVSSFGLWVEAVKKPFGPRLGAPLPVAGVFEHFRLVNGTTSCSGTVEVFSRGEWSGLCTGWWDMMREVKVACRDLDCGNPVCESRRPLVEDGRGISLFSCSGDASSIRQCDITVGRGDCDGEYYHHVTCSVEVKSNQSWASVCEADFDRQDAEVVCGELGCGAPAALQGGLYGEGEGQTWDKEFQCKGKESLLLDCDTSDRENNTCLPGNAVGLTCSGKKQFVTQSTLFLTWSEEYERQYRCVLVRK
uniref:SRCR domain-containing protein n=1 Tax=Salmo trutta TaxID=8032 RepID=A0A674A8B3_SALTR